MVEDPRDVAAIAKLGEYDGVFHVLGGLISPLEGKTPDKLAIKELLARVNTLLANQNGETPEIILATNPSVEGDATAMYLARLIKPLGAQGHTPCLWHSGRRRSRICRRCHAFARAVGPQRNGLTTF